MTVGVQGVSGALNVTLNDATTKGAYMPDGSLRVTTNVGSGLYDQSGALRIGDGSPPGVYVARSAQIHYQADSDGREGVYASDGGLRLHLSAFDPTSLFAGTAGGYYDPSQIATLFQDTAGIVPCTASLDPVARMNDLSGNANHLIRAAGGATASPILHISGGLSWLEFDGSNDNLQALFTIPQPATDVTALQQITWTSNAFIYDGSADTGSIRMVTGTPTVAMRDGIGSDPTTNALVVGTNHVVTAIWNAATSKLAVDNAAYATGNPGSTTLGGLTLGGFGANPETSCSNIQFYGGLRIGRILTDAEIAQCRTFFGAKAGLVL